MANERLRGDLANLLDMVSTQLGNLTELNKMRDSLTASASVERGLVTVVLKPDGAVAEVNFADDIAELSYDQIAKAVTAAAQKAAITLREKKTEMMAPINELRARMPKPGDIIEGLPDLRSMAPVAPEASTLPPSMRTRDTSGPEFSDVEEYDHGHDKGRDAGW